MHKVNISVLLRLTVLANICRLSLYQAPALSQYRVADNEIDDKIRSGKPHIGHKNIMNFKLNFFLECKGTNLFWRQNKLMAVAMKCDQMKDNQIIADQKTQYKEVLAQTPCQKKVCVFDNLLIYILSSPLILP